MLRAGKWSVPLRRIALGFTLVEIMIVVAIVSVLLAVVLPVLARSREKARQSTCLSNFRQIGLALVMYSEDHLDPPPTMQALWDSGQLKSKKVLLCPDDRTENWGGSVYDVIRKRDNPDVPPEHISYSYVYAVPQLQAKGWRKLVSVEGQAAGIMACQTHGQPTVDNDLNSYLHGATGFPPSVLDLEGPILRLRVDGSVVYRVVHWTRQGTQTLANPWHLYSDTTEPPPSIG